MQTLGSLLAAGLFCVVTVWLDLPLLAQWPCEGGSPKVLFSAHPLESCLNDPLILEGKVGPFLLHLRAGGLALVPPLPQGKVWATGPALPPQGARAHLGQLLGHPSLQTKVFLLTPTCCCSGQELSDFNPAACRAGLLHLNSGDPAVVEGRDVGEEASCLS